MYSQLKCPACGGIIPVDVNSEIISCDTCGKAYVNPYYQPIEIEEVIEEPVAQEEQPVEETIQNADGDFAVQSQEDAEERIEDTQSQAAVQESETVSDESAEEPEIVTNEKVERAEEPVAQNKQGGKKSIKPSKKQIRSLVKASVCLLLAVLMFAFSFCPITGERHRNNLKGESGTDYIAYMFYTGRHWDEESNRDLRKIEKLKEKMEDLEEDAEDIDESMTITPSYKSNYSSSYVKYYKQYNKLEREYELSIDGNVTKAEIAQITFIGLLSLLHVLFTGAMMILSAIAFVISLMNLLKNEEKKFFFEKYYYLFSLGTFLTLGVLFGSYMMIGDALWMYSYLSGAFIARLFFECVAFALVLAEKVFYIVKNKIKVRYWGFKALSIALVIIVIGCCFAPAFNTKKVVEGEDDDFVIRYKYSANIMGTGAITEDEYEEKYEDLEHEDYIAMIERVMSGSYYGNNDFTTALEYMMLDKQGESAGSLSTGYIFMIFAILALGGLVCAQLFDGKKAGLVKKILAAIAVACLFAAFICAIVLVATGNAYIEEFEEPLDMKVMLDGGIVCAFLFSICVLLTEILPEKFLPDKKEEDEDVLLDDELVEC